MPLGKQTRGYRHEHDKFALSGLTPVAAKTVAPPCAAECPVQLEARLYAHHALAEDDPRWGGRSHILEVEVMRVSAAESILREDKADHVDPDKWRPLIMSFQNFYSLAPGRLRASTLATIPEARYRPS